MRLRIAINTMRITRPWLKPLPKIFSPSQIFHHTCAPRNDPVVSHTERGQIQSTRERWLLRDGIRVVERYANYSMCVPADDAVLVEAITCS